MNRSQSRPKSGRKPLRQIHVSGKNVPEAEAPSKPRKNAAADSAVSDRGLRRGEERVRGDGVLDRFLLVRSQLSGVVREIDELVAQAFHLETVTEHGKEEAEALSAFLSEILSSLRPWSSRLKKSTLSSPPKFSEPAEPSSAITVRCPVQENFSSMISPSPLVSWRADCRIERGRQVFMLTPLPMSKALTSKCQKPPPSAFPRPVSSAVLPLSLTLLEEGKDKNPCKDDPLVIREEHSFVSPKPALRKPCSTVLVTPCFKVSPPRSCKLLDPSVDSSCWKDARGRKPTPFPLGLRKYDNSQLSESDEKGTWEERSRMYPELLATRRNITEGGNRGKEPSPEWSFSPPKTCIVMEPPGETSPVRGDNPPHIEKTPVWMDTERSRLKRPPGENTLKRELWTMFEAASTYDRPRIFGSDSADSELRGFMDRLDEVSLEDRQ